MPIFRYLIVFLLIVILVMRNYHGRKDIKKLPSTTWQHFLLLCAYFIALIPGFWDPSLVFFCGAVILLLFSGVLIIEYQKTVSQILLTGLLILVLTLHSIVWLGAAVEGGLDAGAAAVLLSFVLTPVILILVALRLYFQGKKGIEA